MKLIEDFTIPIPTRRRYGSGWKIKIYKDNNNYYFSSDGDSLCLQIRPEDPFLENVFNSFLIDNNFIIGDLHITSFVNYLSPFTLNDKGDFKNELHIIVAKFIKSENYFIS